MSRSFAHAGLLVMLLGVAGGARSATDANAPARTLFERWLAAQNGGDFAAYRELCAPENVTVVTFRPRWQGKPVTLVWTKVNGHSSCDSQGFGYTWWLEGNALKDAQGVSQEVLPSAAVDLDGDGRPELLFGDGGPLDPDLNAGVLSLSSDGGDWELRDGIYFPFIGCPC